MALSASSSPPPPPPSSSHPPTPIFPAPASSSPSPNLDPTLYKEYISTRPFITHTLALTTSPSTPCYTIRKIVSLSRQKPSIVLHRGGDKSGQVVGVVKIQRPHRRHYTIGIGDPEAIIGEGDGGDGGERMVWEDLQRVKKWTHRVYSFEFGGYGGATSTTTSAGGGGEREVYTWRRTIDGWGRKLKDMELRVGTDEDGEVVAVWRGRKALSVKNGSMFVKKREGFGGDGDGDAGKWELMVLLTGLSIIEGFVRRQ